MPALRCESTAETRQEYLLCGVICRYKYSLTPGVAVCRLNTEVQRLKDWWKDFADTPEGTKHNIELKSCKQITP